MTTEHPNAETSATPRSDEFLRDFNPTRLTPLPESFRTEATWRDYDFTGLDEFIRWSNIRAASFAVGRIPPPRIRTKGM